MAVLFSSYLSYANFHASDKYEWKRNGRRDKERECGNREEIGEGGRGEESQAIYYLAFVGPHQSLIKFA